MNKHRNIRKAVAFCVILFLLFGSFPTTAQENVAGTGILSVSSASARAGEDAEVTISLPQNPGIASLSLSLDYNEGLTLKEVRDGGVLGDNFHNPDLGKKPYDLVWANDTVAENYLVTGTIVTLVFTVRNSLSAGTECGVSVSYDKASHDILDCNGEDVDFQVQNGKVTVLSGDIVRGDVNGDGGVDSDDAIRLLYHTLFPDDSTYRINQQADFDGNGVTDSDDAIRLLYHTLFLADPAYVLL